MGEPLQLISFVKDSNESNKDKTVIEVCSENLSKVLALVGKNPLSVITICGPSRQGKSFILGHMIRCLTALENEDCHWMDWANPTAPLTGFHWKTSTDPVTKGICIWSKPFTFKNDTGEDISVVLIDTQGTYDEFTTARDMTVIVGISLLMSSTMIFNFFHNLQEDIINSISSYVDFGLLALENGGSEENSSPFQKLLFLIRDWNIPAEFDYGWEGGSKFIKTKLQVKEGQPKEAQEIREKVEKCFQSLDCFLMPPIGETAKGANYNGNISGLGPLFAKHLQTFVTRLMSSELVEKTILGTKITKENFHLYLEEYVKVFNESDVPSPMSLLEATQLAVNNKSVDNSIKQYQSIMKRHQMGSQYLIKGALQDAHNGAKQGSLKMFETAKKRGSASLVKAFEDKLSQQIEDQYGIIQTQNEEKKKNMLKIAKNEASTSFKTSLDSEFPFSNEFDFYEDQVIKTESDKFKLFAVNDFKAQLLEKEEDEVSDILDSLDSVLRRILDEIKEKNGANQRKAEDILDCSINEHLDMYKKDIDSLAEDDLLETVESLHEKNQASHNEIIKKFGDLDHPGNANFQKKFHDKLFFEIKSHYDSVVLPNFKGKLEKMEAEGKELITNLLHDFKEKMEEEVENEEEAVEELAEKVTLTCDKEQESILEEFREESPYPDGTKRRKDAENELSTKLESLSKAAKEKMDEKKRNVEESYKSAVEQASQCYLEEMNPLPDKLIEEATLQEEHEKWMETALHEYEGQEKSGKTLKEEEYISELKSKLTSEFERIQKETRDKMEITSTKLKNCVNECLKFYEDQMQRKVSHLKTDEIMNRVDTEARKATREKFQLESGTLPNLKDKFATQLETEMTSNFVAFTEFVRIKRL